MYRRQSKNAVGRRSISVDEQTTYTAKIAKIGILNNDEYNNESIINFECQRFRLLIGRDLVTDILATDQFSLKVINENEISLWVVLNSNSTFQTAPIGGSRFGLKRIVGEFFILPKKNLFDDKEEEDIDDDVNNDVEEPTNVRKSFDTIVETLYKQLEEAHATDDCTDRYETDFIQHGHLLVKLKPYQVRTIKWMLSRELVVKYHTNGFVEVKKRLIDPLDGSTRFFYNSQAATFTTDPSAVERVAYPTGGILADEMGMGKTIEILDLILLNPRNLEMDDVPKSRKLPTVKATKNDIKCLCTMNRIKDTVVCTKCLKLQHRKCVDQTDSRETPDDCYMCPGCWQQEAPIPAKTTFIVSPQSIKTQWKTETDNRIQSGKISILVYAGSKHCTWVNPSKLASYDVILTDYETLSGEFAYTGRNLSDRVLRNSSVTIKRKSPLLNVNFWRLCLDESQMVIDMTTKHAQIISDLSAVHRWAVTGTPIGTQLDDLFGLISFIKYSPYNSHNRWIEIANQLTLSSNYEPLVSILQPIMWRTCKTENIMNEMDVPKQKQEVIYVELNSLNRYHYNQERDKCHRTFSRLISSVDLNTALTNLSSNTLEQLMEPVRNLRQNCSILHILDKDGKTIVMRPEQMLEYLINTNESDAKRELKLIELRLKSYTALGLGNHKMSGTVIMEALNACQNVLNWAKNYKEESTMIESLLQTKTVHNILLLKGKENSGEYNADLSSFTETFYDGQYNVIHNFNVERKKDMGKLVHFELSFESECFDWVQAALTNKKSDLHLFNQIRSRTINAYENVENAVGTISNVSKGLLYWSTTVFKQRKMFKRSFDKLDEIAVQAELKVGKDRKSSEFFSKLLSEAKECHLNDNDSDDSLGDSYGPPAKRQKKQCILCAINEQLGTYGTFISDNAHKMISKSTRGSQNINPSFQEFILKVILQSNAYSGNINTKVGSNLLTALEAFRFEYQKYKSLLTSIMKNVALFHKVQMRKAPKPTTTTSSRLEWWPEIKHSQTEYVRKVRVNRFLQCMKENSEIEDCGICMSTIVTCVVFECGHQCCIDCFHQMKQGHHFECPFCRQDLSSTITQQFTIDRSEKFTNSSNKIEHIVRKVHQLKQLDPNVKILIFSQWSDILNTLQNELLVNEIPSRNVKSTKISMQKMVKEFKDPKSEITCLLMPYKFGSKGLNLTEATHVFLVEPIINRGEELQTLGRVHRIGQTSETFVHRFITKNTIEETIYKVMSSDSAGLMSSEKCTIKTLVDLFADTETGVAAQTV